MAVIWALGKHLDGGNGEIHDKDQDLQKRLKFSLPPRLLVLLQEMSQHRQHVVHIAYKSSEEGGQE